MAKRKQHHDRRMHDEFADDTREMVGATTDVVKMGVVMNAGSAMLGMLGNVK